MATAKQRFQALSAVYKWSFDNSYVGYVKTWPEALPVPETDSPDSRGEVGWPQLVSDSVAQSPPARAASPISLDTSCEQDDMLDTNAPSPSFLGLEPLDAPPVEKTSIVRGRRAVVDSSEDENDEFNDCVGEGVGVIQGTPDVATLLVEDADQEDSFYSCAAMPSPPRQNGKDIVNFDGSMEPEGPGMATDECLFQDSPISAAAIPFRTPRTKAARFVVDNDEDSCNNSQTEGSDSDSNPSLAFDLSDSDDCQVSGSEEDGNDGFASDDSGDCAKRPIATPKTVKRPPLCPPSTAKPKTAMKPVATPCATFRGKSMSKRQAVVTQSFAEFNSRVFGNQLPANLQIDWSARLRRTAGLTRSRRVGVEKSSRIELSMKVLDNEERTRRTLLHELCHAAAWLIDGELRPPHGARFWHWGKIATAKYPDLAVTRCHSYSIQFKHVYKCTNIDCGMEIGRHSKSIDTSTKVCGRCGSTLSLLGHTKADGTPMKQRPGTPYSAFVKEHFASVKRDNPHLNQAAVMKALADKWKTMKASATSRTDDENVLLVSNGSKDGTREEDCVIDLCDDSSPVPHFNLEL